MYMSACMGIVKDAQLYFPLKFDVCIDKVENELQLHKQLTVTSYASSIAILVIALINK